MLHMLSYDRQGGGGVGGDVNVRVERFHHVSEEAYVAYVVVWSSGGGGVNHLEPLLLELNNLMELGNT